MQNFDIVFKTDFDRLNIRNAKKTTSPGNREERISIVCHKMSAVFYDTLCTYSIIVGFLLSVCFSSAAFFCMSVFYQCVGE